MEIQNITNEWEFYAFLILGLLPYVNKIIKYFSSRKPLENEQIKNLEQKIDAHFLKDEKFWEKENIYRKQQDLRSHGQKIMNALALTTPSCKVSKFEQIKHEFEMYEHKKEEVVPNDENGTVKAYYFEWIEKRENSLKNLKNKA